MVLADLRYFLQGLQHILLPYYKHYNSGIASAMANADVKGAIPIYVCKIWQRSQGKISGIIFELFQNHVIGVNIQVNFIDFFAYILLLY